MKSEKLCSMSLSNAIDNYLPLGDNPRKSQIKSLVRDADSSITWSTNISNEAFYQLLREAFEKGEQDPNVTADELVEELSVKLMQMVEYRKR